MAMNRQQKQKHRAAKSRRTTAKNTRADAVATMKSKKPNTAAWRRAKRAVIRASSDVRKEANIMRKQTGREIGQRTKYTGPQSQETIDMIRRLEAADPTLTKLPTENTTWQQANINLLNKLEGTYGEQRSAWDQMWTDDREGMLRKQQREYDRIIREDAGDGDDGDDGDDGGDGGGGDGTTGDYDDYIGPGDPEGGYPFPGIERGVGFPKESKGYLRSFPSAPEYGGDIAAESLLGYTPEWAGRDSSAWGVLDPRAYGPPQQVMPWMGPLGQEPLRFGKGDKEYQEVAGDYPGSGSRVGQFDWLSRKGGLVPPTATTAWQPTPYSAAEIANWQRFNQGLLAPAIKFGGQTSDQLAQFGLGNSGLLDTNLMKAGKQTA